MDNIAQRIEDCRLSLHISQSELARKIGVTPQAVQKWEKAKTAPRGAMLRRLASVLGVSPVYLQFGIADTAPEPHVPALAQELEDYIVMPRQPRDDDWPFSITREQFSQFSDEQRALIDRYIEILWQSIGQKTP